jgi:hypothetical protein
VSRGAQAARLRRAIPPLAALVLVGVLATAFATAEVLARGELLPYTPMTVERVEVLGGLELWVARESLARLDLLNGLILFAGSGMALVAALRAGGQDRLRGLFLLLAAGLAFLGLDELLALHETIGYNLDFLADVPGARSPEDVLFALYALPALAFFFYYRDLLAGSPGGARLVMAGVALFLAAAALDVADVLLDEQWLEPVASLALVAGFLLVALHHLGRSSPAASLPPDAADTGRDRSPAARA